MVKWAVNSAQDAMGEVGDDGPAGEGFADTLGLGAVGHAARADVAKIDEQRQRIGPGRQIDRGGRFGQYVFGQIEVQIEPREPRQ